MRLFVRMEIEVNADAWQAEYGASGDSDDVESYVLNLLTQCPAAEVSALTVTGFAVEPA